MLSAAVLCLSMNIFHEARGELVPGQYAVAQVTMNRADQRPERVCQVVYAKYQFSWTLDAKKVRANPMKIDADAWKRSVTIARVVLDGRMPHDLSRGATHYHATHIKPKWRFAFLKTKRIGRHVFYASI